MAEKPETKPAGDAALAALSPEVQAIIAALLQGQQQAAAASAGASRSDADTARYRELDGIRRQHLAEDAAREKLGTVPVVALTSFTQVTVDDTGATQNTVIRAGQELDFPVFDLQAFEGKVRLKELDLTPDEGGVTIKRG
jgi:hypothetical protein